ncbi:MAG: hypothetical protein ACRDFC_07360, partial [Ignavibacteria bacterium]
PAVVSGKTPLSRRSNVPISVLSGFVTFAVTLTIGSSEKTSETATEFTKDVSKEFGYKNTPKMDGNVNMGSTMLESSFSQEIRRKLKRRTKVRYFRLCKLRI